MRLSRPFALAVTLAPFAAGSAVAREYPIGKPVTQSTMEISTVYLQPIEMDPRGMMRAAAESDVHLEADVKATAGNKNGFADGEWIPALDVRASASCWVVLFWVW